MKYVIPGKLGYELAVDPGHDDGPDYEVQVYPRTSDENSDEVPGVVYVKVSEFYQFMDWLQTWAPDPRKKKGNDGPAS